MHPQPAALITGGEGDLAAAIRSELLDAGWLVLSPGRQTLDVSCADSVQQFFSGVPRLDLLINNAGIRRDALLAHQPEGDRNTVLDVCLRGPFLCSRAAAAVMHRQTSGHIVNIGSHSGLTGPAGQTAYAAAKAAVVALTQSLATELGPAGIRVNCVLPGWLETKFIKGVPGEVRASALSTQALGRFNSVADTARFIRFLHSMEAVSGQVFRLDSRIHR